MHPAGECGAGFSDFISERNCRACGGEIFGQIRLKTIRGALPKQERLISSFINLTLEMFCLQSSAIVSPLSSSLLTASTSAGNSTEVR